MGVRCGGRTGTGGQRLEPTFHPVWVGVRGADDDPDRMERYFAAGVGVTRRQELPPYLRVNGNFYVWRAAFVRRMETSWMDEGVHGMVEIPESRAFAIDYQYEFDLLEAARPGRDHVALAQTRCRASPSVRSLNPATVASRRRRRSS